MKRPSNVTAVNRALRALDLGPEHAALVALCRSLALAVDAAPGDATLWREYRQALKALAEAGAAGGDDGGATAFLVSIQTPRRGEVGDSS